MDVPVVVDQLAETWQRTAALGAALHPEEWDTPTDCPGWTVKDQLSHLVGTELMLLGRPSPPPAPPGRDHVRHPIGEINEAWVEHFRPRPGPAVLEEFVAVTSERLRRLRSMDEREWEAETPSPIGRVPYRTFMEVRVLDCWLHEQDIRRAVGRPGGLDGPAAEAAVGRLLQTLGYVVGKRVAPPEGTTVAVELTGPVVRRAAVAVHRGRAHPVASQGQPETVTIVTDSETFACLAAGRWAPGEAVRRGRVTVHGDTELGQRVLDNLGTMI